MRRIDASLLIVVGTLRCQPKSWPRANSLTGVIALWVCGARWPNRAFRTLFAYGTCVVALWCHLVLRVDSGLILGLDRRKRSGGVVLAFVGAPIVGALAARRGCLAHRSRCAGRPLRSVDSPRVVLWPLGWRLLTCS